MTPLPPPHLFRPRTLEHYVLFNQGFTYFLDTVVAAVGQFLGGFFGMFHAFHVLLFQTHGHVQFVNFLFRFLGQGAVTPVQELLIGATVTYIIVMFDHHRRLVFFHRFHIRINQYRKWIYILFILEIQTHKTCLFPMMTNTSC